MRTGTPHNNSIDIVRILSAFGIVWYHVNAPGGDFGYSGIVCFLELSAFFLCAQEPSRNYFKKRAERLLIPWLFWSIIYGFLNLAKGHKFLGVADSMTATIFTGTYIHLWYLPFLFICGLIVSPVVIFIRHWRNTMGVMLVAIIVSDLGLVLSSILRSAVHSAPWAEWLHAFPAVIIGSSAWLILNSHIDQHTKNILYSILLITVSIISILTIAWQRQCGLGIPYLLGTFIAMLSLRFNTMPLLFVRQFSDLTMGIYLIHAFVISIIHKFALVDFPVSVAVVGFSMSAAVVFTLRIIRLPFVPNLLWKVT